MGSNPIIRTTLLLREFLPIDIRTFHLRFLHKGVTHLCVALRGALCSSRSMADHLPSKQGVASSNLVYCSTLYAGVAQLAEQLICNQQVAGSNPFTSSIRQGGRVAQCIGLEIRRAYVLHGFKSHPCRHFILKLHRSGHNVCNNRHRNNRTESL